MERTKSGLVVSRARSRPARKAGRPLKRSNGIDFRRTGIRGAAPSVAHFFDRYDRIKFTDAEDRQGGLGVFAKKRRRDRYEAIIGRNRELFQNARVLDLQCGGGIWSLAALDAGAAHVVGVDSRKKPIETATEPSPNTASKPLVRIGQGKMFAELRTLTPAHSI